MMEEETCGRFEGVECGFFRLTLLRLWLGLMLEFKDSNGMVFWSDFSVLSWT